MHQTKENSMAIDEDLIGVPQKEYGAEYRAHVLEMYKLYIEMADKIGERRQSGNSFFLTLNSAIVALVGYVNLSDSPTQGGVPVFWLIPVAGMVLCYLWYRLIHSYRDINSGKFKVVHAIEKILPLRPYDAEWAALGRGENPKLYLPFTNTEMVVPWIFFTIHLTIVLISIIEFIR